MMAIRCKKKSLWALKLKQVVSYAIVRSGSNPSPFILAFFPTTKALRSERHTFSYTLISKTIVSVEDTVE
jgi:hypothetical protein